MMMTIMIMIVKIGTSLFNVHGLALEIRITMVMMMMISVIIVII